MTTKLHLLISACVPITMFFLAGCASQYRHTVELPQNVQRRVLPCGRTDYIITNLRYNMPTGFTAEAYSATLLNLCVLERGVDQVMQYFTDGRQLDVKYRHDWLNSSLHLYGDIDETILRGIYDNICCLGLTTNFWQEELIRDKKSPDFLPRLFESAHTNCLFPLADKIGSCVFSVSHIPGDRTVLTVHDGAYTNNMATDVALEYTNGVFSLRQIGKERKASSTMMQKFPDKVSIRYDRAKVGTVLVSAASPGCSCHRAHALRVFDDSGRYIWQAPELIIATPVILRAVDVDADSIDEIVLCVEDHMRAKVLIFKRVPVRE